MNPLISVIIPAYNVEKYIEEAILSIINQTYKNLEIIIIDDCSTDNTASICKKLILLDGRIKYFSNEVNSGISITLNKGLDIAHGEYILRMDADDISLLNRAEILLNHLIENPDIDIVGSSTITIDSDGNEIGKYITFENHKDLVNTLKYASPLLHIWLCKKSLYDQVGYYRYPPVEDYDFILRCVKVGAKLSNIPDCLYKVRLRDGNTVDLYGYKQLKAFESAYKTFSENAELINLNSTSIKSCIDQKLYSCSRKVLMRGSYNLKNKNKLLAGIDFILAGLISPYQFRYLIRRLSLYLYKRKNKL
ncbi:TPA: glycosyltransferase family 2 protein [Photobacterium damselae]